MGENWGDSNIIDADGVPWVMLNKPDGSRYANGLYRAVDGSGRQRYGEHMRGPLVVLSGQPEAVVERNRERIEASITQGEAEVASGQLTTLDEALSGQPEADR